MEINKIIPIPIMLIVERNHRKKKHILINTYTSLKECISRKYILYEHNYDHFPTICAYVSTNSSSKNFVSVHNIAMKSVFENRIICKFQQLRVSPTHSKETIPNAY